LHHGRLAGAGDLNALTTFAKESCGATGGRGPHDRPLGAVVGVLNTVLEMIEKGATHLGVATDHVRMQGGESEASRA